MVTVTERAALILKEIQEVYPKGPDEVLRITGADGDFEIMFDNPREGDQIIQSEGANVLLIGNDVVQALDGAVIDCEDTPDGPRFMLS